MTLPAVKRTENDEGILPLVYDNAGANANAVPRGYRVTTVNSEPLGALGVYPVSGAPKTGKKATTASTELAISAASVPCQGVLVKADPSNGDTVWVGPTGLTTGGTDATDGYPLVPGESVLVPCQNVNTVFIRRPGSINVTVYWIASAD